MLQRIILILALNLLTSPCIGAAPQRIISLAPHTTELVYTLGKGDRLIAVSDYSDYPSQASELPSVASHQGIDIEQIMRLQPDLILAWKGGNKPQDLARLAGLGFSMYYSSVQSLNDIALDLEKLGTRLGAVEEAERLKTQFIQRLHKIKRRYATARPTKVFYYLWTKPLMSIGANAWATHLLATCSAKNIFAEQMTDYPEVTIEQVVRRKPDRMVAAMHISSRDAASFWQPYLPLINAPIALVNPDKLHRFTPRVLDELVHLCDQLNPKS